MLTLRPYQDNDVGRIRLAFREFRAPLYVLPTGGGKTQIFCYVAHHAALKGRLVYILSHRVELVDQISGALTSWDTPHGFIASSYDYVASQCMVSSIGTLVRRLTKVPRPDLIIVDEAHHSTASTWELILRHWLDVKILGVTATPVTATGKGLRGIFDTMILGPSPSELLRGKYLAPIRAYAPPLIDTSGLKKRGGDYIEEELSDRADKPSITGDIFNHYHKNTPGEPAIGFAVSVQHSAHLAERFRQGGYQAIHLDGSTHKDIRRGVVQDFRAGNRIHAIFSCDLFSEGFDVPGVRVGLMTRPTASLRMYLQQVGRIMRPERDKEYGTLFDFANNTTRFGLPDEAHEWSLDGIAETDVKKAALGAKVCPQCFQQNKSTARKCKCGYVFPVKPRKVEMRDGELVELTVEEIEKRRQRRERAKEMWQAETLDDLIRVEKRRGYKTGWALHVWQAKQKKASA